MFIIHNDTLMSEFISPWIYFVCSEFSNVYFQIQLKIILYILVLSRMNKW